MIITPSSDREANMTNLVDFISKIIYNIFSCSLHKSFQIPLKQLKLWLIWKLLKADLQNEHTENWTKMADISQIMFTIVFSFPKIWKMLLMSE